MNWHYLAKEFYDYADDIEGVNLHYLWIPLDGTEGANDKLAEDGK